MIGFAGKLLHPKDLGLGAGDAVEDFLHNNNIIVLGILKCLKKEKASINSVWYDALS